MRVKLNTASILNVPLQSYQEYTFVVNGEHFKTTRIIAELLSPKISKNQLTDPTITEFQIETKEKGNFMHIFDLFSFKKNKFPEEEIPFLSEVFDIFENKSIEIEMEHPPINLDNVFDLITTHQKFEVFYCKELQEEADYISFNFFKLTENQTNLIKKFSKNIIHKIISNPKLRIQTEDQLLAFVNELYSTDSSFSYLYDYVLFSNVSSNKIKDFLALFDINNITQEMWRSLSYRIEQDIGKTDELVYSKKRYYRKVSCLYSEKNEFNGMINFFRTNSKSGIFNQIKITSSSIWEENDQSNLNDVINYEDDTTEFCSNDDEDPWICFDFKKNIAIPHNYTIRSIDGSEIDHYPKSWVIEGSNDSRNWTTIDEQNNNSMLRGSKLVHTFSIQNNESYEFRYLRMRITGPDWCNCVHLNINCIEFYGELIAYEYS